MLPLVIEDIILEYMYGNDHFDKFKKCLDQIKEIKFLKEAEHIPECETYATVNSKNSKETSYFYHYETGELEVENSYNDSSYFHQYWLFDRNKLVEFTERKQNIQIED